MTGKGFPFHLEVFPGRKELGWVRRQGGGENEKEGGKRDKIHENRYGQRTDRGKGARLPDFR